MFGFVKKPSVQDKNEYLKTIGILQDDIISLTDSLKTANNNVLERDIIIDELRIKLKCFDQRIQHFRKFSKVISEMFAKCGIAIDELDTKESVDV